MSAMDDLGTAKAAVRALMLKGSSGSHQDERVDELLWEYQRALRRVHAGRLAHMLRAAGDKLGYNRQLAYRRCAGLVEEAEAEL